MQNQESLERILAALKKKRSWKEWATTHYNECKGNGWLEAACIGICEAGDLVATLAVDGLAKLMETAGASAVATPLLQYDDWLGALGGLGAGMTYAYHHNLRHGRKRNKDAAKLDALVYASLTEFGCVIGATATTALMQAHATGMAWEPGNLLSRCISLLPAFVVGVNAMSLFTVPRNRWEAYRWISEKNALPEVYNTIAHDISGSSFEKGRIIIRRRAKMKVRGVALPMHEYERVKDPENHGLYIASSSVVPYEEGIAANIAKVMEEWFTAVEKKVVPVTNIFVHKQ